MRRVFKKFFLFLICLTVYTSLFSQEKSVSEITVMDSLNTRGLILDKGRKKPEIVLNREQSVHFLQQMTQSQKWNNSRDPLRQALNQLIFEASNPVFDSAGYFLTKYPYDSLSISWDKFYIWEPLKVKVPVTPQLNPLIKGDSLFKNDTVSITLVADTSFTKKLAAIDTAKTEQIQLLKDTTLLVMIDTLSEVTSSKAGFPFRYLNFPYQSDSVAVAVKSLLKFIEERDSTEVRFTGLGKSEVPVWMNSKSSDAMRYWLKNELNDSVTVWIANQSRNTFGLYLENGVSFRRPVKQNNYSEAKIDVQKLDNSKLQNVQKIVLKNQLWKYRTEAAFVFSQSALTNWVKGGENSVSSLLDITGYADYNNKPLKISSSNFARIKLGFLKSGSNDLRKNVDLIETNSKFNHRAFGKFDFSAIMLFKTQLAPGYSYVKVNNRDTAILVSKLFNPATLTIGLGLDYKPNKKTSINFSPFSYKGTYVTDTANIDQTKYGIPHNKRSLNEPGASFMISHQFSPAKNISITNRLQLFTNYINNPMNIDIDWEMIGVFNLNWFTDIRFNAHLIFDDDTKTVELDDDKQPVLRPDGTLKKTARVQFKEMLGLSLVFKF